jgi:hypothetical protein
LIGAQSEIKRYQEIKQEKKGGDKKEEMNEINEFRKNCIKKHKWVKSASKRLRLEHEGRL